jgi:hypothetical protein
MDSTTVLYHLNKLGPHYHSYFGFSPKNENTSQSMNYVSGDNARQYMRDGASVFLDNTEIKNENEIVTGREYMVKIECNDLRIESELTVGYDEVVIEYQVDDWYNKPGDWYNRPSYWWRDVNKYFHPYILPYLNTRRYIYVEDPFMRVLVSKEDKGSRITLDDILFATRGLMADDTRIVDGGYIILEETERTLVLEPKIDNYST